MAAFYQHGRPQPHRPPPSPSSLAFPTTTTIFPPSSTNSPDLSTMIKCSDCGAGVDLMLMGEHVCGIGAKPTPVEIADGGMGDRRRRPNMRLDIDAAAPRLAGAYGATLSARSPMDPGQSFVSVPSESELIAESDKPGRLGPSSPLTPSSRPSSPSPFYSNGPGGENELSRSVSSTSSLSSSVGSKPRQLPFFEKYQQLVGKAGAGSTASIDTKASSFSQSNNSKLLSSGVQTPPLTPSPIFAPNLSSSPSPSQVAFPPQRQQHNSNASSDSRRQGSVESRSLSRQGVGRESVTELPYASSIGSRSQSSSSRRGAGLSETPSSSILSSSPPRSRKISIPAPRALREPTVDFSSSTSSSLNSNSDNRNTIKASQSTPSKLSGYASNGGGHQRGRTGPKGSAGALDACLEDLLKMTNDGEEQDDGISFYGRDSFESSYNNSQHHHHHHHHTEDTSQVSTPRPPKRTPLPHSQSTPSISSTATPPLFALNNKPPRPQSSQCTTCRKTVREAEIQKAGDGQVFCRPCYAERFLPKCRKCKLPIEGGAVASSDGKVLGKVRYFYLLHFGDLFTELYCTM